MRLSYDASDRDRRLVQNCASGADPDARPPAVFISSTLGELAYERQAARRAVEQLRLSPIMFEHSARCNAPISPSPRCSVGIYWQRYGWLAPDMDISGLEDEFILSNGTPQLIYVKRPAPEIEPRLEEMLALLQDEDSVSYRPFREPAELHDLPPRRPGRAADRAVRAKNVG
jgi:hypothetical protein